MLYYLYYVEGAVTPLLLPYYHMSFQFFLYLLVVSNAIGAFSAFIGGLSDKIGRANLTIYGTLVVALVQLFAIPHITDKWWFAAVLLRHRVRGRRHPRLDPGAHAGLLAPDGPRRRHGLLGPRPDDGRAWRPAWWRRTPSTHLKPWQDQFIISGLVCLGVVVIAFFFLRELSPQLRDQLMVTERERALVEARAMGHRRREGDGAPASAP